MNYPTNDSANKTHILHVPWEDIGN
jgi:hypothetical protein